MANKDLFDSLWDGDTVTPAQVPQVDSSEATMGFDSMWDTAPITGPTNEITATDPLEVGDEVLEKSFANQDETTSTNSVTSSMSLYAQKFAALKEAYGSLSDDEIQQALIKNELNEKYTFKESMSDYEYKNLLPGHALAMNIAVLEAAARLGSKDPSVYGRKLPPDLPPGAGFMPFAAVPPQVKDMVSRDDDKKLLQGYLHNMELQMMENDLGLNTMKARIADGALSMAPFIMEFAATGGLGSAAKKTAARFTERMVLKEGVKAGTARKVGAKVAGEAAGLVAGGAAMTSLQTTAYARGVEEMLPHMKVRNGEIKVDNEGMPHAEKFLVGFADSVIENISEMSGGVIGKAGGAIASRLGGKKLVDGMEKLYKRVFPNAPRREFVERTFNRMGVHSLPVEWTEERFGNALRELVGIPNNGILPQSAEEAIVEIGVLGVFPGARFVAQTPAMMIDTAQQVVEVVTRPTIEERIETMEAARTLIKNSPEISDEQKEQAYIDLDKEVMPLLAEQERIQREQEKHVVEGMVPTLESNTILPLNDALQKELDKDTPRHLGRLQQAATEFAEDVKSKVSGYLLGHVRVDRLMTELDRVTNGRAHDIIYKPMKNAAVKGRIAVDEQINLTADALKTFLPEGANIHKVLSKRTKLEGWDRAFSSGERMGIYMLSRNKSGRNHLEKGNRISKKEWTAIENSLTMEEKGMADFLLKRYDEQFEEINRVVKNVTGKDMKKEDMYSPINVIAPPKGHHSDIMDMLLDTHSEAYKAGPSKGFTVDRSATAGAEVELDAATNLLRNIRKVEWFKAMAPTAKTLNGHLKNAEFRRSVDAATKGHGTKILDDWARDSIRGHRPEATTQMGKIADALRRNGVIAVLGFRITTMLKQSASLFNAMAVTPHAVVPIMDEFYAGWASPTHFKNLVAEINTKSDILKNRSIEREMKALLDAEKASKRLQGGTSLSKIAMYGIRVIDMHTVAAAWSGLYKTAKKRGMSEMDARQYADMWTTRTQPMADVEDLPAFFRGGPLERLFTTFQNQLNQNLNFWRTDIIGARKAGEISAAETAHRVLFSMILPSLIITLISHGGTPDEENILWESVSYPLAPLTYFGTGIAQGLQGYRNSVLTDTWLSHMGQAINSARKDGINADFLNR
jgi:hypothetical protein